MQVQFVTMGRVSTPILLYISGFNRVRGEGEKNWQSKLEKCFSYCYFFFYTHATVESVGATGNKEVQPVC